MTAPSWPTGMVEVAGGVFAYVQAGGGFCVANAGLVTGDDGCLAVDALFTPAMTRAFRTEIARVSDRPVRFLLDTHHHVDHTLGNSLFPEAPVVAHALARREMERVGLPLEALVRLGPHFAGQLEGVEVRLPDVTFDGGATLYIGNRECRLLHFGTAHTVGDVMVHLPAERVLFAGDVSFHAVTPLAFEGHIGRWIEVAKRVEAMPDVDTVVPGHGPVGTKADLAEMRRYLELVRDGARRAFDEGMEPKDAARAIPLGEYAGWTEPERMLPNVLRLYQEFRGELD